MFAHPSLKRDDVPTQRQNQQPSPGFDQPARTPGVSLRDSPDALLVEVELPGVKADQLQLSVNQGVLTLHAPVAAAARDGFQLLHREYEESPFRRAFTLPDDIDVTAISATAKHGLVTITLPRSKAARPRRIAVTAQ